MCKKTSSEDLLRSACCISRILNSVDVKICVRVESLAEFRASTQLCLRSQLMEKVKCSSLELTRAIPHEVSGVFSLRLFFAL